MSILAVATDAAHPKTHNVKQIALLYAFILVLMVVGQLFSFEKFIPLVESFWIPGGHGTATLVACVIVVGEVFALPFLLRMRLSPLMRVFSMACGWIVALLWLKLTFWAVLGTNSIDNVGLFGASLRLPVGWWAVLFSLALCILSAWASWGMWPLPGHTKK